YLVVSIAIGMLRASVAHADVRLPRLVSDHMVLQRDSKVIFWGWADPGEQIRIRFRGRHVVTSANRLGEWAASLGSFAAGGPYHIVVTGKKNTIEVRDVLVGDVWVASGQSNMAFAVKADSAWMTGVDNADRELARAQFPQVRLFQVEHNAASAPTV